MGSHSHPENGPPDEPGVAGPSDAADALTSASDADSSVESEAAPSVESEAAPSAESEATPSVEIPGELQAEIRAFARGLLSTSYYEVLGVTPDVEEAAIRLTTARAGQEVWARPHSRRPRPPRSRPADRPTPRRSDHAPSGTRWAWDDRTR